MRKPSESAVCNNVENLTLKRIVTVRQGHKLKAMTRLNYLKIAIITASAVLVLSSCGDKEDNKRDWLLENVVVSEYYALSDYVFERRYDYEYDSQNRITNRITTTSSVSSSGTLNYNADGDTVKYENRYSMARGTFAKFSQNGNKITIVEASHPNANLFTDVNGELELNAQGLPIKLTSEVNDVWYGSSGSSYWSYSTVTLTWQNGNLIKTEWQKEYLNIIYDMEPGKPVIREEGTISGTNTYIYDDKKPPFHHCNTPKWLLWLLDYYGYNMNNGYNENNIKTKTKEDGSTIIYEYTYNDYGFPVIITWVEGQITYTETYTYQKK